MSRAQEIEQALSDHAHVAECVVADLADLYEREAVTAFVVMRDDIQSDVSSLWDHVRNLLPHGRQPDAVHVVDELPNDPAAEARARRDAADD